MYNRSGLADAGTWALGRCRECTQQAAVLFCVKWRHGRHLEILMSYQKSDSANRCVFTWRKILPNFISIRFETTNSCIFGRGRQTRRGKRGGRRRRTTTTATRWVGYEISCWSNYALKLYFFGNIVWYKILIATSSFAVWKLIQICWPQKHLTGSNEEWEEIFQPWNICSSLTLS